MMHVVATAGHVDHGKSALVRALTGMEPDRFAEEQRRGMTIDLGFAWTELPSGRTVAFVDVPGHERFVTTMLAGVGPVPAVALVVAADEGWRQQTGEHAAALAALGVRHGVLAVTRIDLVEPQQVARVVAEVREHLAGTSLSGLRPVAVSARTGAGLGDLREAMDAVVGAMEPASTNAPVRLWVDRSFTVRGSGTVVTGTLAAGALRVSDPLVVAAASRGGSLLQTCARALHCLGVQRPQVQATARVAVNLRGVELGDVRRGDAVLTPGAWIMTDTIDVHLRVGADVASQLVLHLGAAAVPVRLRPLSLSEEGLLARLRLARPLPLAARDVVLLRDPGRHLIVGRAVVLDARPRPLARRGAAAARARELATYVDRPPSGAELLRRGGLVRRADRSGLGTSPPQDAVAAGQWLIDPGEAARLRRVVAQAVADHARERPMDAGPSVAAVRAALAQAREVMAAADEEVLAAVLPEGTTIRDGRVIDSSRPQPLPPAVLSSVSILTGDLARHPFRAPEAERLRELGMGRREVAAAERRGLLVRICDGVVLAPDSIDRAAQVLSGLPQPFTVSQVRQALDTTRRVAVPLLELLDAQGRTLRRADGSRVLRA